MKSDELGFRLLVRNRSGISLTREGEKIYEYTRKIININNILFEEAAALVGMETGCIKVETFSSVTTNWMPTIFKAFKRSYPGIFVEDDFDGLEDRVITGELHHIIPLEFEKEAYRIIGIAHTDQTSPATKSFISKVIELYLDDE